MIVKDEYQSVREGSQFAVVSGNKSSWFNYLMVGGVLALAITLSDIPSVFGLSGGMEQTSNAAEPANDQNRHEATSTTPKDGARPSTEKSPASVSGQSDEAAPQTPVPVKLIPDQRAFVGSPDTLIRLTDIFAETEVSGGAEALTFEVLVGKKKVAEPSLEGDMLRLKWGSTAGKKQEIRVRATNADGQYVDTKFNVELWKPDYWKLVLTVVGGLGLFLLGMKNLSEGLQAIAGSRLRRMISTVTDNRLMASGIGVLVTMLVQSSSITTVMVVGFVNSGFMTLAQAAGVIMGANIGTTITGWILVLKIGKYGLPMLGAAAMVYLFARRDGWRYTALACMGLGMVFFGLELMKDGFGVIKELPSFEAWFQLFDAGTYFGVLKCASIGCLLTLIVQSSSATLGITIGLAQIGVIDFQTAAALVLGENIGTTITAWLASFGAHTAAKRAAYFHVMFNTLGVVWITAVFPWYLMLVRYFITGDMNADMSLENISPAEITAGIAATHTGFNVTNTIVFLPLAGLLASFLERVVPDRGPREEAAHLANLDIRMLESPAIAIEQSRAEVVRMADACKKMMECLREVLASDAPDSELVKSILTVEEEQDTMQHEIVTFLSGLLAANAPHDLIDEARRQLRMADEYESVSDCIATVLKAHRRLHRHELRMADVELTEILDLHDKVAEYLAFVTRGYERSQPEVFEEAIAQGEAITKRCKSLTKKILAKMPDETLAPPVAVAYNRQVGAYRRVRDHLVNVAEALAGEK